MGHRHYCGCGQSWRCYNEGCTDDDVCNGCATAEDERELAVELEGMIRGRSSEEEE